MKVNFDIEFVDGHYELKMFTIASDGSKIGVASALTANETKENADDLQKLIPLNCQLMLQGILRHKKIPTLTWTGFNHDLPKTYEPTWILRGDGVWVDTITPFDAETIKDLELLRVKAHENHN